MKKRQRVKLKTEQPNYMSDEAFAELKEAMEDVLAFKGGERRELEVTRFKLVARRRQIPPGRSLVNSLSLSTLIAIECARTVYQFFET